MSMAYPIQLVEYSDSLLDIDFQTLEIIRKLLIVFKESLLVDKIDTQNH